MRYDSCRQCTKRRIKCDKGTPRCAKCIKKDIECSGIGKTYQFVENKTPETIENSSSAQGRRNEARHDEGDAFDDAFDTAGCSSLRSTGGDNVGFVIDEVDEDDNVEGTVFSQSDDQQFIDNSVVHGPGRQRAQMSKFSLHYPVALYKPGQVMLMDHCKPILLEL
jgi:hypothetical protein